VDVASVAPEGPRNIPAFIREMKGEVILHQNAGESTLSTLSGYNYLGILYLEHKEQGR
jgi:hypothetical protein